MLLYGLFDDFKGATTTLLLWGDGWFRDLAGLFRELADGRRADLGFDNIGWAIRKSDCSVTFDRTSGKRSAMHFVRSGEVTSIQCHLTPDTLREFADKLDVLAASDCEAGHQYLELLGEQPVQIMASTGEYPADFSCNKRF